MSHVHDDQPPGLVHVQVKREKKKPRGRMNQSPARGANGQKKKQGDLGEFSDIRQSCGEEFRGLRRDRASGTQKQALA
jgi:hypothetical protein